MASCQWPYLKRLIWLGAYAFLFVQGQTHTYLLSFMDTIGSKLLMDTPTVRGWNEFRDYKIICYDASGTRFTMYIYLQDQSLCALRNGAFVVTSAR